jgi:hypothetical protein
MRYNLQVRTILSWRCFLFFSFFEGDVWDMIVQLGSDGDLSKDAGTNEFMKILSKE